MDKSDPVDASDSPEEVAASAIPEAELNRLTEDIVQALEDRI